MVSVPPTVTTPDGYGSVNATPVTFVIFAFVSVIVNVLVPFIPIDEGVKLLATLGGPADSIRSIVKSFPTASAPKSNSKTIKSTVAKEKPELDVNPEKGKRLEPTARDPTTPLNVEVPPPEVNVILKLKGFGSVAIILITILSLPPSIRFTAMDGS